MRCPAAALLLAALCAQVTAEPLTEVPAPWAGRVKAVPAQRLDELEEASAVRIRETRVRLNGLLAGEAGAAELAPVYGRLGALYALHRMYAGAELAWYNARVLDPQAFQWLYYAAHIALEQGEAEQALELLAEATRVDPSYATLPLRRGEALLALNRLDEARAAYAEVAEMSDQRAAALYGLGQIDMLERDWASAAGRFVEVLDLQPEAGAVHYPLGQALVRLGRRDEARAHLARRGVLKPTYGDPLIDAMRSLQVGARSHFEAAIDAVERRDYGAAVAAFAEGLEADPGNARARTSYARALWISGRRDEAEAELRRAAADGPREGLPRFLLAVIRDAAGDKDAAGAGYREVLAIDPGHAGALSYLANLRLRQGDHAAAAAQFEHAIASGVTEMPVYLHYWGALRRAGAGDAELRDKLIEFDKRFPEPPLFRYLLARLLVTSDEAGVRDLARARGIAGDLHAIQPSPPHTELLALVSALAGDFGEAQRLLTGLADTARLFGAFAEAVRLEEVAAGYGDGRPPEPLWPPEDTLLMPPPVDADLVIRNYPAGQAY